MLPACLANNLAIIGLNSDIGLTDTLKREKRIVECKLLDSYAENVRTLKEVESLVKKRDAIMDQQNQKAVQVYKDQINYLRETIDQQRRLILRINAEKGLKAAAPAIPSNPTDQTLPALETPQPLELKPTETAQATQQTQETKTSKGQTPKKPKSATLRPSMKPKLKKKQQQPANVKTAANLPKLKKNQSKKTAERAELPKWR